MDYISVRAAEAELKMDRLKMMKFLRKKEKEGDKRFRIRSKNADDEEENFRMCDRFLHEVRHPSDYLCDQFELLRCVVMEYKEAMSRFRVPRELWEEKKPEAVRDGMRTADFDDFVIAYVLYEWCSERNDKSIGGLLFTPKNPEKPECGLSEDALRECSQKLRKKAANYTITKS